MMKPEGLQRVNRKAQSASLADLLVVITRQCYALSLLLDKVHRREMKSIERSNWLGKRFQSARQDRQGEFDKRNPSQQSSYFVAMGVGELKLVDALPNLVLDQPVGNQRLFPERFRPGSGFQRKLWEGHPRSADSNTSLPCAATSR